MEGLERRKGRNKEENNEIIISKLKKILKIKKNNILAVTMLRNCGIPHFQLS